MSFVHADITVRRSRLVNKKAIVELKINSQDGRFSIPIEIGGFVFRCRSHPAIESLSVYLQGDDWYENRNVARQTFDTHEFALTFAQQLQQALQLLNLYMDNEGQDIPLEDIPMPIEPEEDDEEHDNEDPL